MAAFSEGSMRSFRPVPRGEEVGVGKEVTGRRSRIETEGIVTTANVDIVVHPSIPDGCFQRKEDYPCIRNVTVAQGLSLAERKNLLIKDCVAILVLPGGCGTFDELFDMACRIQLRNVTVQSCRALVVVNVDGYYNGSLAQMKRAEKDGLLHIPWEDIIRVVDTVEAAVAVCKEVAKEEEEEEAATAAAASEGASNSISSSSNGSDDGSNSSRSSSTSYSAIESLKG